MKQKQWFEGYTSDGLQDAFAYTFASMFKGFTSPFWEVSADGQSWRKEYSNEYLGKLEEVEIQTRDWRERKQSAEVVQFEEVEE